MFVSSLHAFSTEPPAKSWSADAELSQL